MDQRRHMGTISVYNIVSGWGLRLVYAVKVQAVKCQYACILYIFVYIPEHASRSSLGWFVFQTCQLFCVGKWEICTGQFTGGGGKYSKSDVHD